MNHLLSRYIITTLLLLTAMPAAAGEPYPERANAWNNGCRAEQTQSPTPPFGDFCPRRRADRYGARQPVRTPEEAKERLQLYFNISPSQIIIRREARMGYIADISNPDSSLADRVIIDKRSGRIRSIR